MRAAAPEAPEVPELRQELRELRQELRESRGAQNREREHDGTAAGPRAPLQRNADKPTRLERVRERLRQLDLQARVHAHEPAPAERGDHGHADADDLQRLVRRIKPRKLIPIHTLSPARFSEFGAEVVQLYDGQWFDV
mgnify:CR=1 FL=1